MIKFPRLEQYYETRIAIAETPEKASQKAEEKLLERGIYAPLDKTEYIVAVRSTVYPRYEAVIKFLHPKYAGQLTEMEKRRAKGGKTSLLIVEENTARLEHIVNKLDATNFYEISVFKHSTEAGNYLVDNQPDLTVFCHNIGGRNGLEILQLLRWAGIRPKTIDYGHAKQDVLGEYFNMHWVYCFIPYGKIDSHLFTQIENAINVEKRTNDFKKFVVKD